MLKVRLAEKLLGAARALGAVHAELGRRCESWAAGALHVVLDDAEKQALGVALYDESFRPDRDHDGLYAWEENWYARRLPPPPARVLIGAAGGGREASVLLSRGYSVVAVEPSARAAAHCRRVLGDSSTVLEASFEDLAATVLDGVDSGLARAREDRFDAVLLGWGSIGHMLRKEDRFRLLSACATLCPKGPILLSVFRPSVEPAWRSKSDRSFFSWGGFLAEVGAEELVGHGDRLGRKLVASLEGQTRYFTLVPTERAIDARAT